MTNIVFTLCSNNYLAHAKTLGDSVRKTNPDIEFIIGLVDKRDPAIDYDFFKPFEIIDFDKIGFPVFDEMVLAYNVIEFNTAVKPFYLEYLLKRYGSGARVFYIDPDIVLYGSMNKLVSILEISNIVLTPMITKANEKVTTDELVALRHGIYNLGFIGIKNTDESMRFLKWWQNRLTSHCVIDKPRGLFVDQKWVDLAPLFFKGIEIFPDPGYNMAWWNLSERTVLTANGKYYVNNLNTELVFFHFSGHKPEGAKYVGRGKREEYALDSRLDLNELFTGYSKLLYDNDYLKYSQLRPLLQFAKSKQLPQNQLSKRIRAKIKSFLKQALQVQKK